MNATRPRLLWQVERILSPKRDSSHLLNLTEKGTYLVGSHPGLILLSRSIFPVS